jgi:hypothetical protein
MLEFNVEPSETIDGLKEKLKAVALDNFDILYSGKQLEDGRTLSDYNVLDGATLSLVRKVKQEDSKFDGDDYLINPDAYYHQLDIVEDLVVETSEFYRTKGVYDPAANLFDPLDGFKSIHCHPQVSRLLQQIAEIPQLAEQVGGDTSAEYMMSSLAKSYLILCHVLDNIQLLTRRGFCGGSYTILKQRYTKDGDIAELIQVGGEMLQDFHGAMATTIARLGSLRMFRVDIEALSPMIISAYLQPGCVKMTKNLKAPLLEDLGTNNTLLLCRVLVDLLDLGLVSYIGSHGTRFDLDYIEQDLSSTLSEVTANSRIGFICSLRRLACLDEFVNNQKVWVFRPLWAFQTQLEVSDKSLAVLTSIQAFADTWGPIWQVSADVAHPNHIQHINVSTGLICRVQTESKCPVKDAIPCHWVDGPGRIPLVSAVPDEGSLIDKTAMLLIGALGVPPLCSNTACPYTFNDLETDFGLETAPLGTHESSWSLDARQIGISASQYVGISVSGTQKRLPCTTLKQSIWNKWKNQPKRANPFTLDSRLGVEISHCTGNARRIRLLDLFILKPIQDLLGSRFPNWTSSEVGPSLQDAFQNKSAYLFCDVWIQHCAFREQIAEMVCYVFELFKEAETKGEKFRAVFLNGNKEYLLPINKRLNSWAEFLEDSPLTAVYAIFNEACLERCEPGHSVATCNFNSAVTSGFTAFETQITIPQDQDTQDKIWLNQRGCLQRLNSTASNDSGLQLVTWEPGKVREIGDKLGRLFRSKTSRTRSREVQSDCELGGRRIHVLVKSTVASCGGRSAKRTILSGQAAVVAPSAVSAEAPTIVPTEEPGAVPVETPGGIPVEVLVEAVAEERVEAPVEGKNLGESLPIRSVDFNRGDILVVNQRQLSPQSAVG